MTNYRADLQQLLYKLFQFDSADLDFGFYAVMNRKREQISQFIETDLLDAVQEGLQVLAAEGQQEAQAAFESAKKQLIDGIGEIALEGEELNPGYQNSNLGKAYLRAKEARDNAAVSAELEAQIFNDLYQFFTRYYQDGDFISQRRYGRSNKYAIPYNGEEVHLHWANFDQYYVKSAAHFTNYSFTVPGVIGLKGGASIQVKIAKVDVERDNVKGDKRFFVYAADHTLLWDEESQVLTIPFEYRPLSSEESKRVGTRNQQEKLLEEAHDAIVNGLPNVILRELLTQPDPQNRSDKDRLTYHLNRYAAENTRDFFVHKDLGGFMTRELDYYIKNEVVNLDDVDFDNSSSLRQAGARAKSIRLIGRKIIAFLEQLEAFQRRLFLKRKFVLQSDYCLTLDKIPADVRAEFYPEILANEAQRNEWESLYAVTVTADTNLENHPHLMIDTALFDAQFKNRLLEQFSNLDISVDGLLVHGDNLQALRLLSETYQRKVDYVYLDPPYNIGPSEILYKNGFKDSSWLSSMENRLRTTLGFLHDLSLVTIAIDDYEMTYLCNLVDQIFEDYKRETVIVNHHPQGSGGTNVSRTHEYALFMVPKGKDQLKGERLEANVEHRPFMRSGTAENNFRFGRPNSFYALLVDPETFAVKGAEPPPEGNLYPTDPTSEGLLRVYPLSGDGSERVWRRSYESAINAIENQEIICRESLTVYQVVNHNGRYTPVYSNWTDRKYNAGTYGTNIITALFGDAKVFPYPKSLFTVSDSIKYSTRFSEDALVMDFFAGSGTTGHAILNLNREDDGGRKYILVEVERYFDAVLKQRVQKVAYSQDWREGKPTSSESTGLSHMFQYIRLESYDDTFHNIHFRDTDAPLLELEDYHLSYFLDHETVGSPTLLDIQHFDCPFSYHLNVTGSGGVLSPKPVDLVTTFNFLLGLSVQTLRRFTYRDREYVRVVGSNPSGQRVCVLWRDVPPVEDMDAENEWVQETVLANEPFDKLYVNGESVIPDALSTEEEFKRRMFEGVH